MPASPANPSEVFVSSTYSRSLVALLTLVVLVVSACGTGGSSAAPTSSAAGGSAGPSGAEASVTPTKLVVGLGYIPSVQFAQFYLAQQKGYYAEAGLTIEFQNKIDADLIPLVGKGTIDIGIGDGTSVIPAASNAIPVQYVATIYGKFPNVVFAKASSGIKTAADLKGKKIGTPGRYGSGWIMLQALLGSAGLSTDDVQIVEYPDFTQRAAVEQGAVDAATGFANNEPVQLELDGQKASILTIDAITPLPGPGLVVGKSTLDTKHDAVSRVRGGHASGDGGDQGGPEGRAGCGDRGRAGAGQRACGAGGDPRRDDRDVGRPGPGRPSPRRDRPRRLDQVDRLPRHAGAGQEPGDDRRRRPRGPPAAAGLGPGRRAGARADGPSAEGPACRRAEKGLGASPGRGAWPAWPSGASGGSLTESVLLAAARSGVWRLQALHRHRFGGVMRPIRA